MQPTDDLAIVPPSLDTQDAADEPLMVIPVLPLWLRLLLVLLAIAFIAVFSLAIWLNPYRENGQALTQETHTQIGLPPCTFQTVTALPCPSCGMTTSFALLMHGDLVNSLRANAVGTLLALFWLFLIPWNLLSAWLGRPLFIFSLEGALIRVIVIFMVLMLTRWGIVLLLALT